MRIRLIRPISALLLFGGLLAACGDDDTTAEPSSEAPADGTASSPADTDDASADEESWPPAEAAGTGQAGEVTVDGVTYQIDATRLCDVSDFSAGDGRTREVHLEGIGVADPEDRFSEIVEITVFTGTVSNPDRTLQGVGWNGPEGLFEGEATGNDDNWTVVSDRIDGPPLDIGDRVTGDLTLRSAMGRDPISASVDIEHPTGAPVPCD